MMPSDNLTSYLVIAIFLLVLGVYGMVRHRTFIGMLISGEFILNGAALNFMAFNRFLAPPPTAFQLNFPSLARALEETSFIALLMGFIAAYWFAIDHLPPEHPAQLHRAESQHRFVADANDRDRAKAQGGQLVDE